MKALISIAFLLVLSFQSLQNKQETETLKTTFVEYADDTYYFTDTDDYSHEFRQNKKKVLDTFNLKGDAFKGKSFVITYVTDTDEDEEGDDVLINIITELKLVE